MKRVLVVLLLLVVAAGAYAVSGKIYARFNKQGPVFEYWANGGNETDLWQGKDGTGFDINFDTIGVTYRARTARGIPTLLKTGLPGGTFDERGWGADPVASSPGYVQIRDIKAGPLSMSVGLAWWQFFGSAYQLSTNTNGTTNSDGELGITYNRFYIDYKFTLGLGDSIVIKQEDWDLMHFQFDFGNQVTGANTKTTNTPYTYSSYLGYIPLKVKINLGMIGVELAPQVAFDSLSTVDQSTANTNKVDTSHLRWGGFGRVTVGLADFVNLYVMGGYFNASMSTFNRTIPGATVTTNANNSLSASSIPVFLGLVWKLAPGIKLTTGMGIQFNDTTTINTLAGTTNKSSYSFLRYGYYDAGWGGRNTGVAWSDEYRLFGDSIMDLAFLKFGADAKFAGSWSVGIAGAIALNDKWTYPWLMLGQQGYSTTGLGSTPVVHSGANQLLSFINFLNYDRQMYIKYEDENVAIKGTISQEGNYDGGSASYQTQLFSMFEYVDITIKF